MSYYCLKLDKISLIVDQLPEFTLDELERLNSHLQLALRFRQQTELSVDLPGATVQETFSSLAELAREVLQGIEEYDVTLADQCLLAAVILDESYGQDHFTNRSLHDEVKLNGRPPIAHITSATSALLDKNYLEGSTKDATITPEGKAKARSLIRMFINRAA